MQSYGQNRRILELRLPYQYTLGKEDYMDWLKRVHAIFFFKNQSELFDCYLTTLNKQVYISYNQDVRISIEFAHFVRDNLPKNIRDNKKRYYKKSRT